MTDRLHVDREALEARLKLHHGMLRERLRLIARRAGVDTREAIKDVLKWLAEDRQRLLFDLFEREDYNPGIRERER